MTASARLPSADRHLVERFSYGVTPALAAQVRQAGSARRWLDRQLSAVTTQGAAASLVPTWFAALGNPPPVAQRLNQRGVRPAFQVDTEVIARTLARRILSERQVHERMADVLSNLLYIPALGGRTFAWRADFDDHVIRAHALGTYRSMLRAATFHPAMIAFLDGDQNARGAINENHARELLELHTVGRAVYTERDVTQLARLLTGFTIDPATTGTVVGYDPSRHQTGRVRIVGWTHPNAAADGRPAVRSLLDHLARHPATARRVATRLCQRFVADAPDRAIIDAVTATYRRTGGDLRSCVRTLVDHPSFSASRETLRLTPSDDVVRSARVLGLQPIGATPGAFVHRLVELGWSMGQMSYRWPAPDGWPEVSGAYLGASRMLQGWDAHYLLAGLASDGSKAVLAPGRVSQLPQTWPRTLGSLTRHQAELLLGRRAGDRLVAAVSQALGVPADRSFASAAEVDDETYHLLRGTVLNDPSGLLR